MPSFTLGEIARLVNAELRGDASHLIDGIATLQTATANHISFIANPVYKKYLPLTKAGAVLVDAKLALECPVACLIVAKPYEAYAQLSAHFVKQLVVDSPVHETASVHASARLGAGVVIGPNAVISSGAVLGDDVVVGAGCFIGDDVEIGENTELKPNVTLYQAVRIGQGCLIHSGTVIGADGFGFAPTAQGWLKIHQLGSVVIGNKVEIGANSCIDRGALDDTVIEDGVIIDNLVQIAHNVKIGRNTAIAGHTAIAGSTTIGSQCTIAGAVGIVGHLQIADKVHITAMSLVTSSITEPGSYSSGTAMSNTKEWRKNAARFRQLDDLANRLQKLEREQKS